MSVSERKHMKYPYTLSAKLVQFNYRFLWNYFWVPRYYVASLIATMPIFYYIQKKVNSPENKAFWAEKRASERKYHWEH